MNSLNLHLNLQDWFSLTQGERDLVSHAVDLSKDDPAALGVDPLPLHDVGGVPHALLVVRGHHHVRQLGATLQTK